MTDTAKLERKVIETAMADHRRLVRLKWSEIDLAGAPRKHWLACAALARHLKAKK